MGEIINTNTAMSADWKAPIEADYKTRKGEKTNRIDFDTVSTISKPHHVNGAAFSFDAYSSVYVCIKIYISSIDTPARCGYNNGEDQNWRSIMRDYSKYEKTPVLFSGAEKEV